MTNLAILLMRKGRLAESRSLLEQALTIHRELGNRRFEGATLINLAGHRHSAGDFDVALVLYTEALEINREVGNRQFEGETLSEMARLQFDRGDLAEARRLNVEALAIHAE